MTAKGVHTGVSKRGAKPFFKETGWLFLSLIIAVVWVFLSWIGVLLTGASAHQLDLLYGLFAFPVSVVQLLHPEPGLILAVVPFILGTGIVYGALRFIRAIVE